MKLNQIRLRIEICMREIILRLEMNFQNFNFFFTVLFILVFLKHVPKYLATGLKRPWWTVGDLQSTSTGLDPGVKI
jgi:hypothetical protein